MGEAACSMPAPCGLTAGACNNSLCNSMCLGRTPYRLGMPDTALVAGRRRRNSFACLDPSAQLPNLVLCLDKTRRLAGSRGMTPAH